jgi:flagellar biosynthesis/type III secretory pathway protein FliH
MQGFDKGRFITAEMLDKIGTIEIESFTWTNLGSDEMLVPDNPRRSVILAGLHEKRELSEKVTIPRQFDERLGVKADPIFPIDLTDDYVRSQEELLFKKKRKMLDEDEAVALELAEAIKGGKHPLQTPGRWKKGAEAGEESKQEDSANGDSAEAKRDAAARAQGENESVKRPAADMRGAPAAAPDELSSQVPVQSSVAMAEAVSAGDLTELREQARSEGYAVGLEEGRAAGSAEIEQARSQGHEQGTKQGFDEGFRVGEERGEIAGEEKVQSTLTMLNEVVKQIDLVRSEILASGQEIFLEFAKVACESIIRGQLAVHDETLRAFMKQTLTPFVERSFIVIEVSQSLAPKVNSLLGEMADLQRKVRVKESSTMADGDFRVEADNEVVIVDLKKAVEALLEKVKGEILSEPGSSGSAGNKGVA